MIINNELNKCDKVKYEYIVKTGIVKFLNNYKGFKYIMKL